MLRQKTEGVLIPPEALFPLLTIHQQCDESLWFALFPGQPCSANFCISDKHKTGQANRQTKDRRTGRWTNRQTKVRRTGRWTNRRTKDKQTDKRQTDRWTAMQTKDRRMDIHVMVTKPLDMGSWDYIRFLFCNSVPIYYHIIVCRKSIMSLKYLVIQLQKVIAVEFLQSILTWKSSLVT